MLAGVTLREDGVPSPVLHDGLGDARGIEKRLGVEWRRRRHAISRPFKIQGPRIVTRQFVFHGRKLSLFSIRAFSEAARPSSRSFCGRAISRLGASFLSSRLASVCAFRARSSSGESFTMSRKALRYEDVRYSTAA